MYGFRCQASHVDRPTFGKGLSLVLPRKDGYEVKTFFADSVGLNEVDAWR